MLVEAHGGAWTKQDRMRNAMMDERLARSGIVVAGLDFRMPPADPGYPASVADIHYAVRWFKSRAADFKGDARRMGLIGTSSGGHQAMLIAMRPSDPRYAALPLAGGAAIDASLRCVVPCWPVIDPLGRFHKVQQEAAEGKAEALDTIKSHDLFWQTEAAMDEGSPARILERGEKVAMPPVLYIQGTADTAHPRAHLDRFVTAYRQAGGRLDLMLVEGMGQNFMNDNPDAQGTAQAIARISEFVHRETA
jgi:acetyl esterase/lipase